ncbi:DUF742 domain-containing protein [Streptomyces sp. PCS3-D2]|uniref:DUF742 domain-containing protein n=1 Tax=Streptomyces sp. PCS3-D2 TaxID=1460244 RepID=UPI00068B50BE|nr:DUF742 domain-containing protein [Streptomyces sp. PCS3-D2]WKV70883.1 DUF742 domain-containing protein [Streptomyces sp. PCS3-D2]
MRAHGRGVHRACGGYGKGRDTPWLDDSAGRVVRPYTASGGRTRPGIALDLLSLMSATGVRPRVPLGPEHTLALRWCAGAAAITVAELAGQLRLPAAVVKVLLSDLMECGAVTAQPPRFPGGGTHAADDQFLLLAVLDGLRRRL